MRKIKIDDVLKGYLACAAWSTTVHSSADEEDDYECPGGEVLEGGGEWSERTMKEARKELRDFLGYAILTCGKDVFDRFDDEQIGHDFWLTRNGHGAGFWDRGIEPEGSMLTVASKTFGSADVMLDDETTLSIY